MKHELREVMPKTAQMIDSVRQAMGRRGVDAVLRRAQSEPSLFFAMEGGIEFGIVDRRTQSTSAICWDGRGYAYRADPLWMAEAKKLAEDWCIPVDFSQDDYEAAREVAPLLRLILAVEKYGQ